MTLKTVVRLGILIIVLLGIGSVPILMRQKDVKPSHKDVEPSHKEAHQTVLPFSHWQLQRLSDDDVRKRLEEIHSRVGVKPAEITPEMLKKFRAASNDDALEKEWDALMAIPGRHSSKEWFTALDEFHRKAQARQVEYRNQAAESKRSIEETEAAIKETERIIKETREKVAASRRRTAKAIAIYKARLAEEKAASRKGAESDNSRNTDTFSDTPEGSLTSPTEVSEPTQSDARRESAPETFVRDTFRNELTQWQGGINSSYADVLQAKDLTSEAFDSLYPTESSRKELQARQRQMQADIANRVQRFLSDNTHGSRDEKLSIIREALTENWGADLAKSVLEQLDSGEDRDP